MLEGVKKRAIFDLEITHACTFSYKWIRLKNQTRIDQKIICTRCSLNKPVEECVFFVEIFFRTFMCTYSLLKGTIKPHVILSAFFMYDFKSFGKIYFHTVFGLPRFPIPKPSFEHTLEELQSISVCLANNHSYRMPI